MTIGSNFEESLLNQLKDAEFAAEFLQEALRAPQENEDEIGYLMRALGQIAKAHGIDMISEKTGISRSAIYKIIKEDSNPSLRNVSNLLAAVGIKISFESKGYSEEQPVDVKDVAVYIMEKAPIKVRTETTYWLQKMIYYSQVLHIANFGNPLFRQKIEAWAAGPVVRDLYECHRGIKRLSAWNFHQIGDPSKLGRNQRQAIDWALDKYGTLTGEILSELTHSEKPWNQARGSLPESASSSSEITFKMISDFYCNRPDYSDFEDEGK